MTEAVTGFLPTMSISFPAVRRRVEAEDLDSHPCPGATMAHVRVHNFTISLDGYGAGPRQTRDDPLGIGGEALHEWFIPTRAFQRINGKTGGTTGVDDDIAARFGEGIGAWIMGRNMFGPIRGAWLDDAAAQGKDVQIGGGVVSEMNVVKVISVREGQPSPRERRARCSSIRSLNEGSTSASSFSAVRVLAAGTAIALAGACGGANPNNVQVYSIQLSAPSFALTVGDSIAVTATVRTSDGSEVPMPAVNWSCDNVSVASVSAHGILNAVGPGSTLLRAVFQNASATATVSVTPRPCLLQGQVGYAPPTVFVPPSGTACHATDVASLQSCVTQIRQGLTSAIRVSSMINCSGANTCLVDLSNVQGPVTVFGDTGPAGFLRMDTYSYPLLRILGAKNVTVANLTFDEGPAVPACDPVPTGGGSYSFPCESTIEVGSANTVSLDRLTLLHAKRHAVDIAASRATSITNSQILDAGVFGIWSGSNASQRSVGLLLENNFIKDVRSNGMFISFTDSTIIRHNTFDHDHRVALFNEPACGGLCPGGELDIVENDHLRIESDQFLNAIVDLNNSVGQAGGVEVGGNHQNTVITNNEVAHNAGVGIGADPGVVLTNFLISGNKLYDNRINFFGFEGTGAQITGNCFTPQ